MIISTFSVVHHHNAPFYEELGRFGEIWRDLEIFVEIEGDLGRFGEIWGDLEIVFIIFKHTLTIVHRTRRFGDICGDSGRFREI